MSGFVRVAALSEINQGEGKVVELNGRELALFNLDGKIHCLDNNCPHAGGPLGEGTIEEGRVVCPWHGWDFSLENGESSLNPAIKVDCFEVKVEGDDVLVKL